MEIPEKLSGLGHQFYKFFGELIRRHSFQKFQIISQELSTEKFLSISIEYISVNSCEILRAWLPILQFC